MRPQTRRTPLRALAAGAMVFALAQGCGGDSSVPSPAPTSAPDAELWVVGCGGAQTICRCLAVGETCESGVIAHSDDLGETWTRTFVAGTLESIAARTPDELWAVGGPDNVMRTTDGGRTWEQVAASIPLPEEVAKAGVAEWSLVRFWDEDHGVIVGVATGRYIGTFPVAPTELFVVFTEDGGETWSPGHVERADTAGLVTGGCFTPDGTGLIAGSVALLSSDGGRTWRDIQEAVLAAADPLPFQSVGGFRAAACADDGTLWLASTRLVLRSNDGGQSWTRMTEPEGGFPPELTTGAAVAFTPDHRGWFGAVGGDALFASNDGGTTWTEAAQAGVPPGVGATAIRVRDQRIAVWLSFGLTGWTADGGNTWRESVVVRASEGIFTLVDGVFPPADRERPSNIAREAPREVESVR